MCSTSNSRTTRQAPAEMVRASDSTIVASAPSAARASRARCGRNSTPTMRSKRGRRLARHRSAALEPFRLGKQRQHQTLAASDVEQSASGRQPSAEQHVAIQRIAAQLSARELPRRDARRDVTVGSRTCHDCRRTDRRAPPPSAKYVATPPTQPSTPPTTTLPTRRSAPNCHGVIVRDGFKRQREEGARAEPRAGLELGEHKQRRDDRIRHVRRQVHLQAVQAEQPADHPAEQKMKAVKRHAADEQPRRRSRTLRGQRPCPSVRKS